MRDSFEKSANQADPLGWFTGPLFPLLLAIVAAVQGVVMTFALWNHWSRPGLQLVAVVLFLVAGVLTSRAIRPNRAAFGPREAAPVVVVLLFGLWVSAAGTVGGSVQVEHWWATIAVGLILAGFAPFISARHQIGYAVPVVMITAGIASGLYRDSESVWPWGVEIVISVTPLVIAVVASVTFASSVVGRTSVLLDTDRPPEPHPRASVDPPEYASTSVEHPLTGSTFARVNAQVEPFLRRVADAGYVTADDRALAAELAHSLRSDLVNAANSSWLDAIAQRSGLVVSDPARLAEQMGDAQRTALRGLLQAVIHTTVVDKDSLFIELRAGDNGAIAVALSLNVDLPEGRRMMLLAPYYLTLQTTVENLSWQDGRTMLVKFQIPAPPVAS
ncbi:MAG TPA: hypothetical protein VGP24_13625 [Glaciihabitans sp.]|jgi:hypothetical protein|nr:hypothetical protein [Glaciihabitans sp.]